MKFDTQDKTTFALSQPNKESGLWYDEDVLGYVLNHPESSLDPASLKHIDIEFETVLGEPAGWGRSKRPDRDEEVSVRHFLGNRKHLIYSVEGKWYGRTGVKFWLRTSVHWLRYFKNWLSDLIR